MNDRTVSLLGNLIATAAVVWIGWYFFKLTEAECYMTWLIVAAVRRDK